VAVISTWNRFCFTGGYLEAAVSLPATNKIPGMWPAVWTMGNLGRAGYGGSLDGMWPYTYDSCDVGTLANQSHNGVPSFTEAEGDKYNEYALSYLPGQRLSSCTCPDDPHHPGPKRKNGSFVGRSAPEIDMIEASIQGGWDDDESVRYGHVSLSGQFAPFNPSYKFSNTSTSTQLYDREKAYYNDYFGGVYQQAASVLGETDPKCYTNATSCFSRYGFEYVPGPGDDAYITWLSNGKKTWTLRQEAMGPNDRAKIGTRQIPVEPMYILINLGMSEGFSRVE
jgi:beta-glucanase (GH16 family)